jgi:hypothetical protein
MLLSLQYTKGSDATSYFPVSAITDRLYARNQFIEKEKPDGRRTLQRVSTH